MRAKTRSKTGDFYGVSLFTGAGIGDLGFRAEGIRLLASCEIERDRSALAALNFPDAHHFAEDLWKIGPTLSSYVAAELKKRCGTLFLVSCTAPCQGMSKSGQGKLLSLVRKGERPKLDPRNRLILPALDVIRRLGPQWVVFENVLEMRSTLIADQEGQLRPILDIIADSLSPDFVGEAYDVEFADYGIPQRRQRLITVYTRNEVAKRRFRDGVALIPTRSHAKIPSGDMKPWVSVATALSSFPPLDSSNASKARSRIPYHYVPVLDPKKYEWIRHTPPRASAFDNQCINPKCRFKENVRHGASHGKDGINRAHKTTPLYCEQCGELLPRPYTIEKDGSLRIMSGYTSAYKRMDPDLPAPALTRNLSYPCSDHKIHPFENRVLSLAEAMKIQTLSDYNYLWRATAPGGNGSAEEWSAPDSLVRLVIGESVPPRFFEQLARHLKLMSSEKELPERIVPSRKFVQCQLL